MDAAALGPLVEWLRTEHPDDLRAVVLVGDGGYETLYVRTDVHEQYTDAERSEIAQDVAFEEIPDVHGTSLYDLGDQHGTLRVFEDGIVAILEWGSRDLLITFDAGADIHAREFVADCSDRLPA